MNWDLATALMDSWHMSPRELAEEIARAMDDNWELNMVLMDIMKEYEDENR